MNYRKEYLSTAYKPGIPGSLIKSIAQNCLLLVLLVLPQVIVAQSEEQKAMAKLSFMIGSWEGTGRSFPENGKKPNQVKSQITYDINAELLVLRLRSKDGEGHPALSLHTVIFYNKKEGNYYYYPFTGKSVRPFKGKVEDGKFICWPSESYRLTFQRTEDGAFQEYGERLVDGKWEKNFEDLLLPTTELKF